MCLGWERNLLNHDLLCAMGTKMCGLLCFTSGGCHDIGDGTSFATPAVAGVIALVLEANPDLTWREVQGVLAETATLTDSDDPSWIINHVSGSTTNTAGFHHSYKYGFGIPDAAAAVNIARNWESWSVEQQILMESGTVDIVIADNPTEPVTSSIVIEEAFLNGVDEFIIESVVIYVDLVHPSRGDLDIILTSPGGTQSILHPGKMPENTHYLDGSDERWKLMTLRNWGENPVGTWQLSVDDQKTGSLDSTCVDVDVVFETGDDDASINRYTCKLLAENNICIDGVFAAADDDVLSISEFAVEACWYVY